MSKDMNPKKTATRKAKRQRRLPPDAVCSTCKESAHIALEMHHPMGVTHEPDLTIPLCKNCHARATEDQLREEVPLSAADTFLDRIAAIFGSLAAFFRFLADSFNRLQSQVKEFAGKLDAKFPEWCAELGEGS
jgi:hypothetical protein